MNDSLIFYQIIRERCFQIIYERFVKKEKNITPAKPFETKKQSTKHKLVTEDIWNFFPNISNFWPTEISIQENYKFKISSTKLRIGIKEARKKTSLTNYILVGN